MPANSYSRGLKVSSADSSGSSLNTRQCLASLALVGTALEGAEAGLSNAISMSARKQGSGEWLTRESQLEPARLSCRPLSLSSKWSRGRESLKMVTLPTGSELESARNSTGPLTSYTSSRSQKHRSQASPQSHTCSQPPCRMMARLHPHLPSVGDRHGGAGYRLRAEYMAEADAKASRRLADQLLAELQARQRPYIGKARGEVVVVMDVGRERDGVGRSHFLHRICANAILTQLRLALPP